MVALAAAQPAHAGTSTMTSFPPGSLIIPTNAVYQDDCGSVSGYGLIYNILRAEGWLTANGKTAITVNYVVSDSKLSPNRCIPSNLHTPPSGAAAWNDGCDFSLSGTAPLVKVVNNAATASTSDIALTSVERASAAAATYNAVVNPQYPAVAMATASTIRYSGGVFVISNAGTDAANFLSLLDGTFSATDSAGNAIDFVQFRSPATCTLGASHYVNIHRAQATFNAPVRSAFTSQPPRLAVLETDTLGVTKDVKVSLATSTVNIAKTNGAVEVGNVATYTTTSAHGFAVGNLITISGVGKSGYNGIVKVTAVPSSTTFKATLAVTGLSASGKGTASKGGDILENYLANAGLTFDGAQGCPTSGVNVLDTTICPNGSAAGQIFDIFDVSDLATGTIANGKGLFTKDAGVSRYTVLWTPHWQTTGSTSAPSVTELAAFTNMAKFLDGQTGLMGECASISSFEGAYQSDGTTADTYTGNLQLQTCVKGASGCSASTTAYGMIRNPSGPSGVLPNCSDPNVGTSDCVAFGAPADEFVQIADFQWNATGGHIQGYAPTSTQTWKAGVTPLIAGYSGGPSGTLSNYFASRNIKDNTPGKANILYLAGHNDSGDVAGTKLALETLLLLGQTTLPVNPKTFDTSRSTPIAAALANGDNVIVTGSFENVIPAPAIPVASAPADLSTAGAFSFPYVKGHLRATLASSLNTTAVQLGAGTIDFDAGASGNIPPVTNAGCTLTSNFDGSCREVFTTTVVPSTTTGIALHPANVFVKDGNATAIGSLMVAGSTLTSTDYQTLIRRILAGYWNGSTYVSQLGGIDRSTVAVIGPSTLANSTRATMAYVGASDGMLHAFCTATDTAHGCPAAGTELWAFMPRVQLPWVRLNKTKIDGSPRVVDAFGDFSGSGTKSFRTILTFTTGSGDSTSATAAQPAIYALDITDPRSPTVVWEYSIPNPGATRGTNALGVGLSLAAGPVNIAGSTKNIVIAQTANGGTAGAADPGGEYVTALDLETGAQVWSSPFVYAYPNPTRSSGALVPKSGIPGGVVAVDKQGNGFFTDVVFGDLYGNVWELDATTGLSRYTPTKPLFSFSTDFHPIGSVPAIYSNGGQLFGVISSGGYVDPTGTASWGAGKTQSVVAIALNTPNGSATLNESSSSTYIPFKFNLGSGESGFSQAQIVGGQLFVTSDTADVNSATYGSTGSTGHVYQTAFSATTIVSSAQGGASSIATVGGSIYSAASNQQQQIAATITGTSPSVDTTTQTKLTRMLWLRTQ